MIRKILKKMLMVAAMSVALSGAYSVFTHQGMWESHASPVTLPDMSEIVARNSPAVVNITVSGKVRGPAQDFPGLDPNDPFYEFFRRFRIPQPRGEQPVRGQGSGFIVREDGIVLTNAHVINDADEVIVRLNDKREFKAKVLGADKASDVAVLKVEAHDLPTVKIGSSTATRVGEWVLAIGSPFGFESSATAGIVSAKSRSLPDDNYVPFIQTDVAVNPGNSGGPLFNMAGEVIGINSQIYSRTGGYQGLSFAIPIDVAISIQDQILKHGKVQRGRLGVLIQEVNQSLAESFGLPKPAGALISSVEKNSPAARAGLEPGDVILLANGKEIGSSNELPSIIASIRPGDIVKLQIWRKGKMRKIDVKVGSSEAEEHASEAGEAVPGKLGLALRPLRPDERYRIDGKNGLLVENVSGAARLAGIRPGDVVLSVNGEPVTSVEQLRALVAKASKRIALLILRGDTTLFIPVDLR
jgi:serine protease Do